MTIFIIGGGPSVRGFDFSRVYDKGCVIGINDSIFNTRCHAGFTMDGLWLNHRWEAVKEMNIPLFVRISAFEKHVGLGRAWNGVQFYDHKIDQHGMSESNTILYGNNSGAAALNAAYLTGDSKIFLFGFDLCKDKQGEHWYPQYEWRKKNMGNAHFAKWIAWHREAAKQFTAKGVEVYNVSPISKITAYPRISFREIEDWL